MPSSSHMDRIFAQFTASDDVEEPEDGFVLDDFPPRSSGFPEDLLSQFYSSPNDYDNEEHPTPPTHTVTISPPPPTIKSEPTPLVSASLPSPSTISRNPKVKAKDRIKLWQSSYSTAEESRARAIYGDKVTNLALNIRASARTESSTGTYGAGLKHFLAFCDECDVGENLRMPADEWLLSAFVAHLSAKNYSANTIKTYMSGIHAWHSFHNASWHGDSSFVKDAKTAACRESAHLKRPPRPPVSREHLVALSTHLDITQGRDAAIWAAALCTFYGCRRLGEILVTEKFEPKFNVSRSVPVAFRNKETSRSVAFHIPWTKTTKQAGFDVVITGREDTLCPVNALSNHLRVNDGVSPSSPLFAFIEKGRIIHLRKRDFMSRISSIWSTYDDLEDIQGHSFRIGGAVDLLLSGVNPLIVAATGGWKSLAFMLYWRRVEHILPEFTTRAYTQADLDKAKKAVADFGRQHNLSLSSSSSSIPL